MNWKIAMLEIAELGLFACALWISFRMGRAGTRKLWCILSGWLALAGLTTTLAILSLIGYNNEDSNLVKAMPEGTHALVFLLFGWIPAWAATAVGKSRQRK